MRFPLAMGILAVLMTGCLGTPGGESPQVKGAAFDRVDARWIAMSSTGCGLCGGQLGFSSHAEHHAFFVFEKGHLLLIDFNEQSQGDAFQVSENVSYDPEQLEQLLLVSDRADGGSTYVVRAYTARVEGMNVSAFFAGVWDPTPGDDQCADYGAQYAYAPAVGEHETISVVCSVEEGDPMWAFASTLRELAEGTRAHGEIQGISESQVTESR